MQQNLVIVESPAKAKTIEKFLGKDYKVMSSYGHIRDLKKKELSIDPKTLEPCYEVPQEKAKLVAELKKNVAESEQVWLASDEDREGEAIAWHLCEVLGLEENKTNRIVFHEITKPAILKAIETPRRIDMNLVNAQQARRILDRIVGFKLSPILWRKVKPSLSAGRVQSVAVRLIVEREREIQAFETSPFYRINAIFVVTDKKSEANVEIKAELEKRFKTRQEATNFLTLCNQSLFAIDSITKKPLKRMPAPPFTTSTLQQEAARKLGFTVSQTMMVAQRLYENGHITYMRTDSVNLSTFAQQTAKEEIEKLYGANYSHTRNFQTHSKGAQEAHEAIRPTYIANAEIEGTNQEKKLYNLIWKRTLASQMAEAQVEKTTITIGVSEAEEKFHATGEMIVFDGFLKVYRESTDDDDNQETTGTHNLPNSLKEGFTLECKEMTSTERFTSPPPRYNEASLVHKMEELGIGRPSTYAPTISTIQQRGYVQRGDKTGTERTYIIDVLKKGKIKTEEKTETIGSEKGKLLPTDIGSVVNDFLTSNFEDVIDYNFTARVESQFDLIAEGKEQWNTMMKNFDNSFEPVVERVMNTRSEHRVGERELGIDPKTQRPVFVKIGRFGPVVQIGNAGDEEKPKFAQVPSDKSIETISLEEALELFKLPKKLGVFEDLEVQIGSGRYGPYVQHGKQYISIPKGEDPLSITFGRAVALIETKRMQEQKRHLRSFGEGTNLEILDGRYGPYIAFEGKNYRLPKKLHAKAAELTFGECMDVIKAANEKKK